MKKNIYILAIIIVVLSCRYNSSESKLNSSINIQASQKDSIKLKRIKKKLVYNYKLNDSIFGYTSYEDDEDNGPKSIFISDSIILFTNPVYDNVVLLNYKKNKITHSKKLTNDNESLMIRDAIILGNNIIAIGDRDSIIILNKLNLTEKTSILTNRGQKNVTAIFEKYANIYLNVSDGQYSILRLNYNGDHFVYQEDPQTKPNSIRGKQYKLEYNSNLFLSNDYGNYELFEKIPKITEYDCINLDFNENKIVYFYININEIIITVLDY